MKTQIAVAGVSLSLLGSLISVSSAEAAGLFSIGDSISGSGGPTGIFGVALNPDLGDPPPALNYFGTTVTPPENAVIISSNDIPPEFVAFTYGSIEDPSVAPTTTVETFFARGATGGFSTFDPLTNMNLDAQIRSFQSAPFTSVEDFLVLDDGMGLTVSVDLNGPIESGPINPGAALVLEVPVIITGEKDGDIQTFNGIFRFSTVILEFFGATGTGSDIASGIEVFTGPASYSWQLDVIKDVPEPSSMVSLLALGALGGGMAIKRKVSK